ncbi:uncharacterized protein LOC135118196 isoform X2 [Helicoverpa armigera]|uniref:uncharacterized protein LOC135118196 isoform X2 n=1 Tax=Helicoverpa armigera TaxID=29058 RepID=UPI0030838009
MMPRNRSKSQSYDDEDCGVLDRPARATFNYAEDVIRKFDGRDRAYPVTKWIQDIDDNGDIFEWSQTQRLLVARRSLTGTAALWLSSEKTFKCWESLKLAISKEFPDAIDAKTIHEMMSARKKRPNESCIDYMFAMKELGKRGKMADYVAIKYIIDGIRDNEINKIMLYGITTYSELKEKLKIYEMIKEKTRYTEKGKDSSNIRKEEVSSYRYRCYDCGEKNHRSENCPHRNLGKKCFRCNGFGHISPNCPVNSKSSSPAAPVTSSGSGTSAETLRTQSKRTFVATALGSAEIDDRDYEVGNTDLAAIGRQHDMADGKCHGGDVDVLDVNKPGIFTKPVKSVKMLCGNITDALVDSGSDVNLIRLDFYKEIGSPACDSECVITLTGLGLSKIKPIGQFRTSIEIDGYTYRDVIFYVIPNETIPFKVLIGHEFLQNVITVMKGGSVWMKPNDWLRDVDCCACSVDVVGHVMDQNVREEVARLVESYKPQQTKEAPIELKIILKDDIPVAQRPRRIAPREQAEVDKQIREWLDQGIIRH